MIDLVYILGLVAAFPIVVWKMATRARVRAGLWRRLGIEVEPRPGDRPCIWVHGVSVGEVIASKPLVREIQRELPDYEVVISTTTNTGLEVARKHFPGLFAFYYPLDLSWAVRRVLRAVRPSLIVLVELEIWPNFLRLAYESGVPVVLVNGRISQRSFRGYRLIKRLLFRPLAKIRQFCVQDETYARRFVALGVPESQVLVTGSLKYDNLASADDAGALAADVRARLGLGEAPVLVCGSTHPPEEREALAVYGRLRAEFPSLRLILAPRHIERAGEVAREAAAAGFAVAHKTEIDAVGAAGTTGAGAAWGAPVIVVDTIGELARIYAAATVAFVGGSLVPHGGQNMLEPAGLGRPTLFGPHVENFRESADLLLRSGGAEVVADAAALEAAVRALLRNPAAAEEMGRRARAAVDGCRGAARRTVAVLKDILSRKGAAQGAGDAGEDGSAANAGGAGARAFDGAARAGIIRSFVLRGPHGM